jgi:adenylate cyclase
MWKFLRQQIWQWRIVLAIAPSVAGLVLLLRFLGWLQPLEWWALDQFFCLRAKEPTDDRIIVVEVQEDDLRDLQQWPISDKTLADLLTQLQRQQPKAIGLDLYRDLPVEPGHPRLVKQFQAMPNLVGIAKVLGDKSGAAVRPPAALAQLGQVGANDAIVDGDGKVRRALLYVTPPQGENVLSLSLTLSMIYLQDKGIQLEITPDQQLKLGKAIFPHFQGNDGGYVRANDGSYQVLLNYRGSAAQFRKVSMRDVLTNRIPPDLFRDRIVLIGPAAESLKDLFYTPYSSNLSQSSPELMPGVYLHANLTSQILSTALDDLKLIQVWDKPSEWVWIFAWSGIGTLLAWALRSSGDLNGRSRLRQMLLKQLVFSAIAGILALTAYGAFLSGWWIPVIPAALASIGASLTVTVYIASSADRIRKTFGRYLTAQVVNTLLEHPEGLKLGGERKKITILTSDLRGFTAIAERLPAEEVVQIINFYLGHMADVITQYHGTIDEFMGDGILVLFGAPTARPDDAERAIACAVAMQLAMTPVNEKMQQLGVSPLEMGIGINTGEVVVGNIGSEKRAKYGVMGNQVNLTYRIESFTVGGEIIISESTLHEAGRIVQVSCQRDVQLKGIEQPVPIYSVVGITGPYNLMLPSAIEELNPLFPPLHVRYVALVGKQVSGDWQEGKLTKLSAKQSELWADSPIPLMTNLKLNLTETASSDLYAKVIECSEDPTRLRIHFTAVPPDVAQIFGERC